MWSAPVTIAAPAIEPISIEVAKVFLRIDGDDRDVEIDRYRKGARAEIERVTSTRLITQTIELKADGFADLAHLPIGPVQSIASLSFRDSAGATTALDPSTYELFGAGLEPGIRLAPGAAWPVAGAFAGAIAVRLVAGYGAAASDMPDDLELQLYRVLRGLAEERPVDVSEAVVNHRIWAT